MLQDTRREENAIAALKDLAAKWPSTLWLYAADGCLRVMQEDINGEKAMEGEGFDQGYVVATINIESDGGDW